MNTAAHRYARRPGKCPACGSERVAVILYGLPFPSEELSRDVDEGRTALGGCCVTGDDPAWQCADCGERMFRQKGGEDPAR